MLNTFRTKIKFWSHVILWPVIIAFIAFYGWSFIDARRDMTNVAAVIDGNKINMDQVIRLRERFMRYYQNMYKDNFAQLSKSMDFEQMALDQLISDELMIQFAGSLGIVVTTDEVRNEIKTTPYFLKNGQFSPRSYQMALNSMHMTPDMYESSLRHDLLLQKVRSVIASASPVTIDEFKENYIRQHVKIDAEYVMARPSEFVNELSATPEEAQSYYADHPDEFKVGDQLSVDYIAFLPEDFEKDVNPTEEEVDDYYLENLDKYKSPEQVRASHILIKVDPNDPQEKWDEALARATSLKKQIEEGADFETLAKSNSDDTSASAGGDLGFFSKGRMVKPFEDAAWNLEIGDVSEPVKSNFGYHIIKKTDYKKGGVRPLDEIESSIISSLKKEKARELALAKARELYAQAPENTTIQDLAKNSSMTVKTTEFFEMMSPPQEIGMGEKLGSVLTNIQENEISVPVETNLGAFIFSLKSKRASHVPPFEEIKEKAEQAVKQHKATEQSTRKLEEIWVDVQNGMTLEEAAEKNGKTVETTGEFAKSAFIPKIGQAPELIEDLFKMKPGEMTGVRKINDRSVIIKIKSSKEFLEDDFQKEIPSIRKQLINSREAQITKSWVENRKAQLVRDGKITIVMPRKDDRI